MPYLAPLALLLALGTSISAFARPTQSTSYLHPVRSSHAASARSAHPAGMHHHGASAGSALSLPSRRQRGHQIAQPVALPSSSRGRRTVPARRHNTGRKRSPRQLSRLELPAARQLEVVSVLRTNADRPRLVDLPSAVTEPVILPQHYDARGRLMVPAALVGSHAILLHQNAMADLDGLGRVQNDADLEAMRERGMLVSLPAGSSLAVDDRLPVNRRYTRPWTASFLNDLAHAHFAHFHTPLQVNSAVRTVEFQQHLIHINGNAAPADGDTASPHLTGQAIDLAKRGMPLAEIAWMRGYLLPLIDAGKIDVEEEFQQSCFHISVYRKYASTSDAPYRVASRGTTTAIESLLR